MTYKCIMPIRIGLPAKSRFLQSAPCGAGLAPLKNRMYDISERRTALKE